MVKENSVGRVTIPTDVDVVPETLELLKRWGADAIRDCDGTDYPEELKSVDAKVYSTYYTTRKDNEWAKANPDEIQQMYIMTPFYTAVENELSIHLMNHLYPLYGLPFAQLITEVFLCCMGVLMLRRIMRDHSHPL